MFNEYSDAEDWEEYASETEEYAPPLKLTIKQPPPETEEEKQKREAKHQADIEAVRPYLSWVGKESKTDNKPDNHEFPSLSSQSKAPPTMKMPKFTKSTVKSKIVMNGPSYEKQAQINQTKEIQNNEERTKAFEILANKEELEKSLVKTRMCNSLDKKEACPHGERCRFAHCLEELNVSKCLFGDQCRFAIVGIGGKLTNGKKCCAHKHPGESTDEFYKRTGLDKYKTKPKPAVNPIIPTQVLLNLAEAKKTKFNLDRDQGLNWADKIKATNPPPNERPKEPPKEPPKDEVVLKVPRELAMQAMELALKSGSKAIRVDIVG